VVAVDMPGFGASPELPDGLEPSAANLATGVLDFYDALAIGAPPAIAGISLGAWTAIECARQGDVTAVVALCPAGFWRETLGPPSRAIARARRVGRAIKPLIGPIMRTQRGRRLLGRSYRYPERVSPSDAAATARAYVSAPAYPEASRLMRAGRVEDMTRIRAPITIAWAEHDALVRNRPLRDGILPSSVRQVELPGCGHVPTWDDPELVARVILQGSDPGA
jgi:pimeloyl-ACP methyl ester carboxylesterase